ncbi:MAG: hypothetical protein PGN16_13805 [Sphingomonas phyllosphaerae]|uniref:hypothetical protein n=1 Tax=Sphingomonas phyllosphaerae TaxID=257003 RepID=UPI002FFB8BF4
MNIVLKIQDAARQTSKLNKLLGTVSLTSMIDLLSSAGLEANPRLSKVSRVTDDIEESLAKEPEIFHFMSKGILVAASTVEELDRSRFRLEFDDPDLEGILDGGHNSLAAGRFILRKALAVRHGEEKADAMMRPLKTWEKFKSAWTDNLDLVREEKAAIPEIRMPIEVIYPSDDTEGFAYFQEKVLAINAARNNNAELTAEARANKLGYYDEIKAALDPALVTEVEWKTNDGGRIKVRELVALSLIPLSKIEIKETEQVRRSPTVIFSSKGQCVDLYDKLMAADGVAQETKGNIVEVVDPKVKSALALMKDMPRLFDLVYKLLPEGYNKAGGRFGKIDGVRMAADGKVLKSHYYREPISYSYGDGFMYPLVFGLSSLMRNTDDGVTWITDPDAFIKKNMPTIMKSFYAMIAGVNFDPAKVGKSGGAYNLACDLVAAAYKDELLRQHGIV